MGCGASSNPQVSPRSTPVVPDVGGKSRAFDPSSSDKENVAPRGEESHEEFMARYAQKAAARKEGKPIPWDDKELAFRNKQLAEDEKRKQEVVQQMREVDAPDWVKERAVALSSGDENGVSPQQAVEAATWASRVIYTQKTPRGEQGAGGSAELALHTSAKVFGDGGAKAKGFGYDKAFDGDLETYYHASPNGRNTSWVGLQFALPCKLTRLRFHPRREEAVRMAGGVFEASARPDPESDEWSPLHVVPGEVGEQWYTVTWDAAHATPFLRFRYRGPEGPSPCTRNRTT